MKVTIERKSGVVKEHENVAGMEYKPAPGPVEGIHLVVWIDAYKDVEEGDFYPYSEPTILSVDKTEDDEGIVDFLP